MKLLNEKQGYWLDLLWVMTDKEMRVRYKRTYLGFLWMILQPLSQMFVLGFIFQFFVPVRIDNYFLFLFSGLLPWNFFSSSISQSTAIYINEKSLLQKAKFPREIIVLSVILSKLIHFLFSMILLLAYVISTKILMDNKNVLDICLYLLNLTLLAPVFLWLAILTSSLSLLLSSINIRYRDIGYLTSTVLSFWFYATPIVYSLDLVPKFVQNILLINPMTGIIEAIHNVLLFRPLQSVSILLSFLIGSLIIVISLSVFKKIEPYFDDWI